jgi:hypothetical protein
MKTKSTIFTRLTAWLLMLTLVCTIFPAQASAAELDYDSDHDHLETITEYEDEAVVETPEITTADTVVSEAESTPVTDPYSGTVGNSAVCWQFTPSNGRLTITGSGDCDTFNSKNDQPWAAYRTQIKAVVFNTMDELSIDNIAYWFDGCTNLETAEVPYTTPVVGTRAFADCSSLRYVMLYQMRAFTIEQGAFAVNSLTALQVLYISDFSAVGKCIGSYNWGADDRAAYFEDVYGTATLATGYCSNCGGTYSYTLGYDQWTSSIHCIRHWCSNCGYDQCGGVLSASHSYSHYSASYDRCSYCGYQISCTHSTSSSCSHGSYRYYYEYYNASYHYYVKACRTCGEEISSTRYSHSSSYSYEYYNSSYHYYYRTCSDCDTTLSSGKESHSYSYSYSSYSSTQHIQTQTCSDCGYSTSSYVSHSFTYGSWSSYSATQHRRLKTCSVCGYSTYEYASHSLSYGSWSSYSTTQHKRTASCSCGYSTTEYANHSYTNGSWSSASATQHSRTKTCSCGYSTTETASHSLTYGSWTSYSSSQHRRTVSCSTCGYSSYEYASHSYTNGSWSSVSDAQHSRTKTCSCGYSTTETENHTISYGDWEAYSEAQHHRTGKCGSCDYTVDGYGAHTDADDNGICDDCGYFLTRFSVTVPANLNLTVSKNGKVYSATSGSIVNNSTGSVSVTSVTIKAENGWTLVPYTTNMANAKVDAKQIGFSINSLRSTAQGSSETLSPGSGWTIAKDSSLPLSYDAVVSASSDAINEQVLTVVFVVGWAA